MTGHVAEGDRAVEAGDLEVGDEEQFVDVGRLPRRVPQLDPQGLLVAVDLEADRVARLDASLRLGGPDQAVEAAVVEVAGEAIPGVGRLAAVGELGVEEKVVRVRDGVDVAVQGGGNLACEITEPAAVEAATPSNPQGELPGRAREDQLGLAWRLARGPFEGVDGAPGVVAVGPFEVVALEARPRPWQFGRGDFPAEAMPKSGCTHPAGGGSPRLVGCTVMSAAPTDQGQPRRGRLVRREHGRGRLLDLPDDGMPSLASRA